MSYFVHKACNYRLFLVQTTAYLRYLMAEVDPSVVGSTFKQSWCQHLFMRYAVDSLLSPELRNSPDIDY